MVIKLNLVVIIFFFFFYNFGVSFNNMLLIVQLHTNINYCSYLLYFCDLLPNYFLLTFAIMHHVNVQLIVIHNLMYQFYGIFKKT